MKCPRHPDYDGNSPPAQCGPCMVIRLANYPVQDATTSGIVVALELLYQEHQAALATLERKLDGAGGKSEATEPRSHGGKRGRGDVRLSHTNHQWPGGQRGNPEPQNCVACKLAELRGKMDSTLVAEALELMWQQHQAALAQVHDRLAELEACAE